MAHLPHVLIEAPAAPHLGQLYRQFGVDPAKATDQGTVDNVRKDCLRELQKIKRAWRDLHYQTVKGALLLSPSPPAIATSQLRLVDAG